MNLNTDIELIEASDLQIDASVIDVSEVESQEDKEYLISVGTQLLTIEAKANFAIKKVVATIQGRANLEKGRVIHEIQRHFGTIDEDGESTHLPKGGALTRFYRSVGLPPTTAANFAQAYRTTLKFANLFDGIVEPTKVLAYSDRALQEISRLPAEYQEEVLADVAAGNEPLTAKEIITMAKEPEVKLTKAEELLARARRRKEQTQERWEEVKADPQIKPRTTEYETANKATIAATHTVNRLEQEVADLQAALENHEKEKEIAQQVAEENAKRSADLEAELNRLKYDSETIKEQRRQKVANSLLATVPAVMSDVQRFYADIQDHDKDTVMFLEEQMKLLTTYIHEHL